MNKRAILFPLILSLVAAAGVMALAKDVVVESQWLTGPLRIDGMDQDWQDATFLTDGGSKAQYAVKNDGKNLYVLFIFDNPLSSTTLEYTGMRVYFNTEGKKSKDLGVLFTKKPLETEAVISELEKRGQPLTDQQKAELRKSKTQVVFAEEPINEKKVAAPSDPAVKTDPPAYRTARKQRVLYCEFRIPLSRVNEARGIGAEPGKTIKLGFEWGGMTQQIMRNMIAERSDRSVSAGDRGVRSDAGFGDSESGQEGSGGFGSTGGGVGELNRDPRYKKQSFWIDLKLAAQ